MAGRATARPSLAAALRVAQDRIAEKSFVEKVGGRPAPWAAVNSAADLTAALERIGCPAILKTTRFGYDGKGQALIRDIAEAPAAWEAIGGPAVLEGFIHFTHEFSILIARGEDGQAVRYDPPHNVHRDAILRSSTLPAPAEILAQAEEATALAIRIAEELGYVGVLACEFFATENGPVFNEMAPRVHNSGIGRSRVRKPRSSRTTSARSAACRWAIPR